MSSDGALCSQHVAVFTASLLNNLGNTATILKGLTQNHLFDIEIKSPRGASAVAWWVRLPPAALASHRGASCSPCLPVVVHLAQPCWLTQHFLPREDGLDQLHLCHQEITQQTLKLASCIINLTFHFPLSDSPRFSVFLGNCLPKRSSPRGSS